MKVDKGLLIAGLAYGVSVLLLVVLLNHSLPIIFKAGLESLKDSGIVVVVGHK